MLRTCCRSSTKRDGIGVVPVLLLALWSAGCASWKPGWDSIPEVQAASPAVDPEARIARARRSFESAGSRAALERAIADYEAVVAADPDHLGALAGLCESHTLLGAAYADERREKRRLYQEATRFCERALYTNDGFRRRIESGASFEEAVQALGEREIHAAVFWVTSVSYFFKEGLRGLQRLRHYKWMVRSRSLLERVEELDPEYGDGAVYFSLGIYYLQLPRSAGGDREKSARYLERAVETAPDALLPRWGRARYFHVEQGDRDFFVRDLEWVAARDLETAAGSYPWNVFFQRDARRMLADPDAVF